MRFTAGALKEELLFAVLKNRDGAFDCIVDCVGDIVGYKANIRIDCVVDLHVDFTVVIDACIEVCECWFCFLQGLIDVLNAEHIFGMFLGVFCAEFVFL